MSSIRQILAALLGRSSPGSSAPTSIKPAEVAADLANLQLIDVREPDEWRSGHIAGAVHMPLGRLQHSIASVDRQRNVAVICQSGARSQKAAQTLREYSIEAASVSGGMLAWARAGLPIVRGTSDGGKGHR